MFYCIWRLLVVMLGVCFVTPALATDRFYPNVTSVSPNGRFKVEAKSPDNPAEGWGKPFARDFTYTLTDTVEQRVVWTHKQGDNEPSPTRVWVHDSGWAVATSGYELFSFDPAKGRVKHDLAILDQFTEKERTQHVHDTSAGPMWANLSRWSFLEFEGKLYFVVRPHWGRHVVMDVTNGSPVGGLEEPALRDDAKWAIERLRKQAQESEAGTLTMDRDYSARLALHVAAQDQNHQAVEYIKRIGVWANCFPQKIPTGYKGPLTAPQGTHASMRYGWCQLRYDAHVALRKLGHSPQAEPAVDFWPMGSSQETPAIRTASRIGNDGEVLKIKVGQRTAQVLERAGRPDRIIDGFENAWEYHVDGEKPCTVRVVWGPGDDPIVFGVKRISPPTWKTDTIDIW
jgi:hypothetical protein